MEILVFTDSKTVKGLFVPVSGKKEFSCSIYSVSDFRGVLKEKRQNFLVYYDVSSAEETVRRKDILFLSKLPSCRYVLLDPKNVIADPSREFFLGCADYLGKNALLENITNTRIKECLRFRPFDSPEIQTEKPAKKQFSVPFSGKNWTTVKTGNEYVFAFMYVEFTNISRLTREMGHPEAAKLIGFFHDHLEKEVMRHGGKIWMWNDTCTLILFPFDGKDTSAAESALELYLNQPLMRFGEHSKNIDLKFLLHVGTSVYNKRGNTGTIISDTINSIYHIGQKFADRNCIFSTEEYFSILPNTLKLCFNDNGEYEGHKILRFSKV